VVRFKSDGVVYRGLVVRVVPGLGEWMTLVTVGWHSRGLCLDVDVARARQITIEGIREDVDGVGS
jgi:hypothetical protein